MVVVVVVDRVLRHFLFTCSNTFAVGLGRIVWPHCTASQTDGQTADYSRALDCHVTDHAALLSVVLQLGTLYQQPFKTYLHHHPVSAAISKLNYFAGRVALIHRSTFV